MAGELLDEFIYDTREHLNTVSSQLLLLEKEPDSLDHLNGLAGTIHTIKGNSGFLNLKNLYGLLHTAENILQTLRGQCPLNVPPEALELIFQVMDTVEAMAMRLENGLDDQVDWLPTLNQQLTDFETSLNQVLQLAGRAGASESQAPDCPVEEGPPPALIPPQLNRSQQVPAAPAPAPPAAAPPAPLDPEALRLEEAHLAAGQAQDLISALKKTLASSAAPARIDLALDHLDSEGLRQLLALRALAPGRVNFLVAPAQVENFRHLWRLWDLKGEEEIFPRLG